MNVFYLSKFRVLYPFSKVADFRNFHQKSEVLKIQYTGYATHITHVFRRFAKIAILSKFPNI